MHTKYVWGKHISAKDVHSIWYNIPLVNERSLHGFIEEKEAYSASKGISSHPPSVEV